MPTARNQFDLAVIGGGPAGSATAITAARMGAQVVLCEARDFPRHKVCGEFVSAEALGALTDLLKGVPAANAVLCAAPEISRTRLLLGERTIETAVVPAGRSLTRFDLDALLWEAAWQAGVESHTNCDVFAGEGDGPFTLKTSRGDYGAQAVVIASGRWSQFTPRRILPPGPKWIGVKAHFREANPALSSDLYFFAGGYCGVQPVGSDAVNACAMVRSDYATELPEVFALHPKLAERAAGWEALTTPVTTAPLVFRPPQPVAGNTILAGDAAAFIDPFVGDGISIALRSGRLAAQWVCEFISGRGSLAASVTAYQQEYIRQFVPLIAAAARIRSLQSLPAPARYAVFELLRFPGLLPYMIRKTRRAG